MDTPSRRQAIHWAASVSAVTLGGASAAAAPDVAGSVIDVSKHSISDAIKQWRAAGKGTLYFPAGSHRVEQPIQIDLPAGAAIAFRGDGPSVSRLVCDTDEGIAITFKPTGGFAGDGGAIVIDGLSVQSTRNASGAGIRLNCEGSSGPSPKKLVRDVILSGWAVGVDCVNCTFTTLDSIDYQGAGVAVRFAGEHDPVDNFVRALRVFGARDGIEVLGASEGIYVEQCTMLGVERGVHWHTPRGEPLLSLTGCHISASRECVLGHNLIQPIITGNLFYQGSGAAVEEWAGIRMTADNPSIYDLIQLSHNTIHGFPAYPAKRRSGIVIDNRTGGILQSNIIQDVHAGIALTKTSREFKVLDNVVRSVTEVDVLDHGTANHVRRV